MAKQLNVNLAFTADTSKATAQMQNLQNQLSQIASAPAKSLNIPWTAELQEASAAAMELKVHLQNATNIKTGNLDFSKLNTSIQKSGKTLAEYGRQLQALGPQGQQAFMSLANAVAQAEIPIRRSNAALSEMMTTLKNTARWQLSSSILHGFMGAVQSAYGYAQDLNASLNDIRIVTGQNIEQMTRFAEQANKAAKALSTTTTDYTNASLIYYQQGLSDAEVAKRTEVTVKMANAAGQSAQIVSDQLTAVWNNFYDGSKSLEYYADVMTALGAATASSTEEIAGGLEKFAAIADTIGLSYEYAASALATITSNTRQSEEVVGTALKTIFARIQGLNLGETLDDGVTLNKYSEALQKVGISIFDTSGQMKDMDRILDEMAQKWDNLSKAQQAALAQTVAGTRQYTQLVALMDNWNVGDSDSMTANLRTAYGSKGTLQEQAEIYAESWEAAQDRVRAAAEDVYSSLLDEDFFIDVLNGLEKVLNYVDSVIDSLGGLKGVLATVSVVMTKVFSAQMAEGLRNMAHNIYMSTEGGRQAVKQEKFAALDEMQYQMEIGYDGVGSGSGKAASDQYAQQIALQKELIENSENMSEAEIAHAQQLLDLRRQIGDQVIKAAEREEQSKDRLADSKQKAYREMGEAKGDIGVSTKDIAKFDAISASMKKISMESHALEGAFSRFGTSVQQNGNASEKEMAELGLAVRIVGKELNMSEDEIVQYMNAFKSGGEEATKAYEKLMGLLNAKQGRNQASMQGLGVDKKTTQEIVDSYDQIRDAASKKAEAERRAKLAQEEYKKSIQSAKGVMKDWANGLVSGAQAAMSFVSIINMASSAVDALTNPDMSGWEKFLSVLQSSAMIITMTVSMMNSLTQAQQNWSKGTLKNAAATLIDAAAESILAKEKKKTAASSDLKQKELTEENKKLTENTVQNTVNAGSEKLNQEGKKGTGKEVKKLGPAIKKLGGAVKGWIGSHGALLGGVGLIAAGIAVVVGTVALAINQYNKLEKEAQKAEEAAARVAERYEEVKANYDEFANNVDNYKNITKSMEEMTKGTVEYNEALLEANAAAMELIKNYEGLSYTIDNGVIKIDEASLEQLQQIELEKMGKMQAMSMLSNVAASNARAKVDRKELVRDIDTRQDNLISGGNIASATGAGAGAGALIGAGIGSIVPVIGNAVGAAVGAVIGGVVGLVGGTIAQISGGAGTKKEDEAIDKIIKHYSKIENKGMFADNKEFKRVLEEEIGVSSDLIDGLVANREAIQKLTDVEIMRLKKEEGEWEAAFSAFNINNEAYTTARNQAYLNNMATNEKEQYRSEVESGIDELWKGRNIDFWEAYLREVMGDEDASGATGDNYRIVDRGGGAVTIEKKNAEGAWERVGNKNGLDEDAAHEQLVEARLMARLSENIGDNLEVYKGLVKDLENSGLAGEKNEAYIDDILTQYSQNEGIDLSKYNYEDLMKLNVNNIDDIGLQAAVEKAKNNYIDGMSDLEKKIVNEPWYKQLTQEQKEMLWSIKFNEHDTMDTVKATYNAMQVYFDQNQLQASVTIAFGLKEMLQSDVKDWDKIKEQYDAWKKENGADKDWSAFLALTEEEQIAYIDSYLQGATRGNVIAAKNRIDVANNAYDAVESGNEDVANAYKNAWEDATGDRKDAENRRNNAYNYTNNGRQRNAEIVGIGEQVGTTMAGTKDYWSNDYFQGELLFDENGNHDNTTITNNLLKYFEDAYAGGAISEAVYKQAQELFKIALTDTSDDFTYHDKDAALRIAANKLYKLMGMSDEQATTMAADLATAYMNGNMKEGIGLASDVTNALMTGLYKSYDTNITQPYNQAVSAETQAQNEYDHFVNGTEIPGLEGVDTAQDRIDNAQNDIDEANIAYHNARDSWQKYITSLGISADELTEVSEGVAILNTELADNKDLCDLIAASLIRYKKAVDMVANGYSNWMTILKEGTIFEQIELVNELQTVMGHLFNIDGEKLSKEFLLSEKTISLLKDAALGSQDALNELQALAAQDLLGTDTIFGTRIVDLTTGIAKDASVQVGETISAVSNEIGNDLAMVYFAAYQKALDQGMSEELALGFADNVVGSLGYALSNYTLENGQLGIESFVRIGDELSSIMDDAADKVTKVSRKKMEEIIPRYKEVDDIIDDITDSLDDANRELDKMYGNARLKQMGKVNNLLKEEIKLLEKKQQENANWLEYDRRAMETALNNSEYNSNGLEFIYDNNGNITNYNEVMQYFWDKLEDMYDTADAYTDAEEQNKYINDTLKPYEEWLMGFLEKITQYDETKEMGEDITNEIADNWAEWQSKNAEALTLKMELELSIDDRELEWLEYQLSKIEDDAFSMAEALGLMVGTLSENGELVGGQLQSYLSSLESVQEAFGMAEHLHTTIDPESITEENPEGYTYINDADYYEQLETITAELYENLQALNELDKAMMHYYADTLAAMGEELDKVTKKMENQSKVLDHYKSLMAAFGKETDYKSIGIILEGQSKLLADQTAAAKATWTMYQEQVTKTYDRWQAEVKANGEDSEAAKLYKKEYEAALDAAEGAQDAYLAKAAEWAESLKAILENTLADLNKSLEKTLTGGTTFDALNQSMERAKSLQEEYLTATNKVYETNKLMRTAQQEIDKTTNTAAKKRLQAYIKETQQLQNKSELSQYELEIQQAKYDLVLAEIALEEAQNAKSTVRLRRDSEGNLGYVYTADANAIADAQQKLEDAQNSLYNIGLEGAADYAEKYQQQMQEMYDDFIAIEQQRLEGAFASEEEYHAAMEEAKKYHYDKLSQFSELYQIALSTDSNVAADTWTNDTRWMINQSEDWKTDVTGYVEDVSGAFKQWQKDIDTINEEIGLDDLATKVESVVTQSENLLNILTGKDGEQGLIDRLGAEATAVLNLTGQYAQLKKDIESAKTQYEAFLTLLKNRQNEANGGGNSNIDGYAYQNPDGSWSGHYDTAQAAAEAAWAKYGKNDIAIGSIDVQTDAAGNVTKSYSRLTESGTVGDYTFDRSTYQPYEPPEGDPPGGETCPTCGKPLSECKCSNEEETIYRAEIDSSEAAKALASKLGLTDEQYAALATAVGSGTSGGYKSAADAQKAAIDFFGRYLNDIGKLGLTSGNLKSLIKIVGSDGTTSWPYGVPPVTPIVGNKKLSAYAYMYQNQLHGPHPTPEDAANTAHGQGVPDTAAVVSAVYDANRGLNDGATAITWIGTVGELRKKDTVTPNSYTGTNYLDNGGHRFFNPTPSIMPSTFDTGGYTGSWAGSYGKLAMLHQKELILNPSDTENFLASMNVLERILQVLDLQAVSSQLGGLLTSPGFTGGGGTLEQNVHIEASFPNATNHSEIEEAFSNLVNLASQYANRK